MRNCSHCNEPVLVIVEGAQDSAIYCCQGCRFVAEFINSAGLEAYYDIKEKSGSKKGKSLSFLSAVDYRYLDEDSFRQTHSYKINETERVMEFYLEGVHCLACLWIIEKAGLLIPDVVNVKLEMNRSVAVVTINEHGSFAGVATQFQMIGYKPHALQRNEETHLRKKMEERSMLIKIGVAGASAGNIMLYSISIYAGAEENFLAIFHYLTLFFAFPVLTYCSSPLYKSAWQSLKQKTINIDVPISLALITGGLVGYAHLFMGIEENYFDSLTALVFLLLISRYFLMKIQEKSLSVNDLQFRHISESILKADDESLSAFTETHLSKVIPGDCLKVKPEVFIPADGQIIRGFSSVDNSLLTGESQAVPVQEGDKVFAGTQNLSSEFIMRVAETGDRTTLGKMLKSIENGWALKSPVARLTNQVAGWFVSAVIVLSVLLFIKIYQTNGFEAAFAGALTLLIVTCPCALAIATPMAFYRSLSEAAMNGIIIKNDDTLEKISKIQNVFLDKTGTLTYGQLTISTFHNINEARHNIYDVIYNLEAKSIHPAAQALKNYALSMNQNMTKLVVHDYKEIVGSGVCGTIDNVKYEIKSGRIYQNSVAIASFTLEDTLRTDTPHAVNKLRALNVNLKVLSGDKEAIVAEMSHLAGLGNDFIAECTPETKARLVKEVPSSMMVGDGANDALAMKSADVGVAVLGAMDISLKASDVYLMNPGLKTITDLIVLSRETMKVIKRNFFLSILYNSLSVVATFMGLISPLMAAIIMPLSSLTVVLSTLIGTRALRDLWK